MHELRGRTVLRSRRVKILPLGPLIDRLLRGDLRHLVLAGPRSSHAQQIPHSDHPECDPALRAPLLHLPDHRQPPPLVGRAHRSQDRNPLRRPHGKCTTQPIRRFILNKISISLPFQCIFLCKNFEPKKRVTEPIHQNGNIDHRHASVRRLLSDRTKDEVNLNRVVVP